MPYYYKQKGKVKGKFILKEKNYDYIIFHKNILHAYLNYQSLHLFHD